VTLSSSPLLSYNPASGQLVWQGRSSDAKQIQLALFNARQASKKWAHLALSERIVYLENFHKQLESSKDQFAELISSETGKPLWESRGEILSMMSKIGISIKAYHKRCEELKQTFENGTISITRHRPHGVVLVFGPFNFPGHLPNGHIVPALLAGNCVIFKPSELTPAVGEYTMGLWERAGLPKGVLNLVQGGPSVGAYLLNTEIDGLFFTGSWRAGKIFLEKFAATPEKILALEMGGNNPLIVHEVKDLKAAAYLTIQSAFLTAGQRCTCARRLIVPKGTEGDQFVQELLQWIAKIKVGSYTDRPEPFMGPVISATAAANLLLSQEQLKKRGGISLVEMKSLRPETGLLTPGLIDMSFASERPDEEYFGPLLQLIRVSNLEEALLEANKTAYGLAAGIMTDHAPNYELFYQGIKAGIVNWNMPLTGASSAAPFGGLGHSGNHRPSAFYAADYCSYPVASFEVSKVIYPATQLPGFNH
jgi:succinylglutamic semialdehyde dehydrogenase